MPFSAPWFEPGKKYTNLYAITTAVQLNLGVAIGMQSCQLFVTVSNNETSAHAFYLPTNPPIVRIHLSRISASGALHLATFMFAFSITLKLPSIYLQ